MKRFIIDLLTISVIALILPVNTYSQSAQLVCAPDTTRVDTAETFFIDIMVDESATGLHCFNITIDFDTSLVALIAVDEGALIDDSGQPSFFFWDSTGGLLNIGDCLLGYGLHVNGPGPVARLTLESKSSTGATSVIVDVVDFSDTSLAQIPIAPVNGSIVIEPPTCCGLFTEGFAGNTDCDQEGKRNLADITQLIDRVYISKTELCCEASGNVDGDIENKLNLADITKLIDHIYISKEETSACL